MNKRISFFGCSFTAGEELHDHKILNISLEECNDLKRKQDKQKFQDFINRQLTLGAHPTTKTELGISLKITEYNRTVGYPAKMCNTLKLDYQNYAFPGSSIQQAYISLLMLDEKKVVEPNKDVLFFGLTSVERILSIGDNGIISSDVLGFAKVPMEVVEHYTSHKLIWEYFNTLNSLMDFAELRGYKLLVQPMTDYDEINPLNLKFQEIHDTVKFHHWDLIPVINKIWKRLEKLIVLPDETLVLTGRKLKHPVCGYYHPSEMTHIVFAEMLAPRVKEILCLKD